MVGVPGRDGREPTFFARGEVVLLEILVGQGRRVDDGELVLFGWTFDRCPDVEPQVVEAVDVRSRAAVRLDQAGYPLAVRRHRIVAVHVARIRAKECLGIFRARLVALHVDLAGARQLAEQRRDGRRIARFHRVAIGVVFDTRLVGRVREAVALNVDGPVGHESTRVSDRHVALRRVLMPRLLRVDESPVGTGFPLVAEVADCRLHCHLPPSVWNGRVYARRLPRATSVQSNRKLSTSCAMCVICRRG